MPATTHALRKVAFAAGGLALVILIGLLAWHVPASAATPVQLVSSSAWGPDANGYAHIVGEVLNTSSTTNQSLIRIDYNLYSDVLQTHLIAHQSTYVGYMGADVVAPAETSPFQDHLFAPTFKSYRITNVSSTIAATPPDHAFTLAPKACPGTADPSRVCGTITNTNPSSVDYVRVIMAFYNGTTANGDPQVVDEAFAYLETDGLSSLGLNGSADFVVTREAGAPSYTSTSWLAESSTTVPEAPGAVWADPGNQSAQVSWQVPISGGRPITRYTVTSSPAGLTQSTADGSTTTLLMTGLTNGTPYTFTVTATNVLGTGFASIPSEPQIPATRPDVPTGVTAIAGDHSATVSWTAPFDEGRPITAYTVTSSPGGVTAGNNGSTTTVVVPGLDPTLIYTFTVTATNVIGTSPASAPSNAVRPVTGPSVPRNVSATAGNHQATVSWTAPASNGGSPVTAYLVTSSPGGRTATAGGSDTQATVTGLTNGTSYTFTVTASNLYATGAPSAASNAVVPAEPPGAPTNVTATAGSGFATVTWTAPASTGTTAITSYTVTGYTVTGSPRGNATVGAAARSAIIAGIPTGTYTFRVTATNTVTGPASTPSSAIGVVAGGQYHPQAPVRILDTRVGTGGVSNPVAAGHPITIPVAGVAGSGVPALGDNPAPAAVVLNVTITNPNQASDLTAYPTGVAPNLPPTASNLNFLRGQTVPNLVVVALGLNGQVSFANHYGNVDVIADVQGWISTPQTTSGTAGQLRPVVPSRIMDTRIPLGAARLSTATTAHLQVAGAGNVPLSGASAVVLNVTVTNPSTMSHLIVFPTGSGRPLASNLNFGAGQTVPNRVMVKLGTNGQIDIFNLQGNVDVIVDVNGWFTDGSDPTATHGEFTGTTPTRILDTRLSGGALGRGEVRKLQVTGPSATSVPVPAGATGVAINVTVTNTSGWSHLIVYPSDAAQRPGTSDLNWLPGVTVPNLVVVKLASDGSISIFNLGGSVDVVVDVNGWYN